MKKFGVRLKQLRERKKAKDSKWTQEYIADAIGVARPTYTAYENGTKQPPLETVNKLADLFEVSSDYLFGRTNQTNYKTLPNDETNIAFFGGRKEDLSEEEAAHLEESLEMFRLLKAKRMAERKKD
jgi:transcriptional regulator with XRE-family HTH domain